MARSLKVLGLALVVIAAFSAVMASSALAVPNTHHFTVKPPAIVTGTQEEIGPNKFKTTNNAGEVVSEITCKHATYEGTVTEETNKEITVTPTYPPKNPTKETEQNCTAFGLNAEIVTNHCAFKLTGKTDANGHAAVEEECTAGSVIEIKVPSIGCTLKVGPQTEAELEKGVHYKDTENPASKKQDITIEVTVTSIAYTTSGFCPASGNGTSGHLESTITAEAWKDKGGASCETKETGKTTPPDTSPCEVEKIDLTLNTNVTET